MSSELLSLGSIGLGRQSSETLAQAVNQLGGAISKLIDITPIPIVVLKSQRNILSSNVADDVLILSGLACPPKHRIVVEDFNINFSTVAGTIKLVILDQNNNILNNIVLSISASQSGIGRTVLEDGQRLAVMGQTAGAGIFGVYCSGVIQKVLD